MERCRILDVLLTHLVALPGRWLDGTMLLVTHDRRLLERVQVTRRLVLADGQLTEE